MYCLVILTMFFQTAVQQLAQQSNFSLEMEKKLQDGASSYFFESECEAMFSCNMMIDNFEVCAYHSTNFSIVRFENKCLLHRYNCGRLGDMDYVVSLGNDKCKKSDFLYDSKYFNIEPGQERSNVAVYWDHYMDYGCYNWLIKNCDDDKNYLNDIFCAYEWTTSVFMEVSRCYQYQQQCEGESLFFESFTVDCIMNMTGLQNETQTTHSILFRKSQCGLFQTCSVSGKHEETCVFGYLSQTYMLLASKCLEHKLNCHKKKDGPYLQTHIWRCKGLPVTTQTAEEYRQDKYDSYQEMMCKLFRACSPNKVLECAQHTITNEFVLFEDMCQFYKTNCEKEANYEQRKLVLCLNAKRIIKTEVLNSSVIAGLKKFYRKYCDMYEEQCHDLNNVKEWHTFICVFDIIKMQSNLFSSRCYTYRLTCSEIGAFKEVNIALCSRRPDSEKQEMKQHLYDHGCTITTSTTTDTCLFENTWSVNDYVCALDFDSSKYVYVAHECLLYSLNCNKVRALIKENSYEVCLAKNVTVLYGYNGIDYKSFSTSNISRRFGEDVNMRNVKNLETYAYRMCKKYEDCIPQLQDEICAVDYETGNFLKLENICHFYKFVCEKKGVLVLTNEDQCD